MIRILLAALLMLSACAARPRPDVPAEVQTGAVVPTQEEAAEPLPAGIVPLAKEQDEVLSN